MEMSAAMINKEVFKEPRGFIKLLEIILAICAFATAVGPHLTTSSVCKCNEDERHLDFTFEYPYVINENKFVQPHCENSTNETTSTLPPETIHSLSGNCKSASEFYVFVGVVVFLYSLGAIVFYVVAHELYEGKQIIPKADFIITILFTLLWLISSSAFADALSKIKHYTNPAWPWESDESSFHNYYTENKDLGILQCTVTESANYATLNISVIFGFLNMIVWAGNNWFLYKETDWFESGSSEPPMPTSPSHVEPKV